MYLLPACAHYESRMVSVAQKHKLQLLLPVSQASGSKCRSVSQSSRHLCLFAAFKSACAVFFTSHDHIYAFLKEMYCSPLPNNDSSLFFFFFLPQTRRRGIADGNAAKCRSARNITPTGANKQPRNSVPHFQRKIYSSLILPVALSVSLKAFSSGPFAHLHMMTSFSLSHFELQRHTRQITVTPFERGDTGTRRGATESN